MKTPMVHDPDFLVLDVLLPPRPVCLDVGANEGQSIVSIKALRPEAIIYAFEPNPGVLPALRQAAERFPHVTVIPYGLGSVDEELTFYLPSIHGITYHEECTMNLAIFSLPWVEARWRSRGGPPILKEFTVAVRRGDAFDFAPHFIKIDVEGAEFYVLCGLEATLRKHKPLLLIENSDWDRVTSYLATLGYRAMMPREDFRGLVPFEGERVNAFYVHNSWRSQARKRIWKNLSFLSRAVLFRPFESGAQPHLQIFSPTLLAMPR